MLFQGRTFFAYTLIVFLMTAGMASITIAESPAPATDVPSAPAKLKDALTQLSDQDPTVREAAREQLMTMSPTDLPALRAAVQQLLPLPPGDAQALREIVMQVYLAGDNAEGATQSMGFMGISMVNDELSVYPDDDESDPGTPIGVLVAMRLPGFDAYRALRDGDIILSLSVDGIAAIRIHYSQQIMQTIGILPPGQHVRLQVIRNGKRINTTVTLNPRPRELPEGAGDPQEYRNARMAKAQAFWADRFARIVDQSTS